MAKPNYQFEKRQRDLAKKKKQDEKRQRKLAEKTAEDAGDPAVAKDPAAAGTVGTVAGAPVAEAEPDA